MRGRWYLLISIVTFLSACAARASYMTILKDATGGLFFLSEMLTYVFPWLIMATLFTFALYVFQTVENRNF